MCELLVGLPDVTIEGVGEWPLWLRIEIRRRAPRPSCGGCRGRVHDHGRRDVALVDLPVFGRPARLVWSKQRWRCPNPDCAVGTWTEADERIAPARAAITDRAGRWATFQVGRHGRSVAEVAADLACDWHTIMDAVMFFGTPLVDDPKRFGDVDALGLDETLFCRQGHWRTQCWSTQIVDVARGQLLDIVPGRDSARSCRWLAGRPVEWRDRIRWATLDLSGPYRSVFDTMLPNAVQVADAFHVVKLANTALDETRRRVQNETCGHRGRKDDPLYRCRRKLVMADERLDDATRSKLHGLLEAGDPKGEVRNAWHAKEVVREIYTIDDPELAAEFVERLGIDLQDESCPPEVRKLGRPKPTATSDSSRTTAKSTTVAQAAGVSRSWLYRQTDLHFEITRHRHPAPTLPRPERASSDSQHQRIENMHDEIRRLNAENITLRQQLAEHYGQQRADNLLP